MIRLNAIFLGVTLTRPVVLVITIALVSGKIKTRSRPSFTHIRRRVVRPPFQDSHPRADDLDFRWKLFWDCIWQSLAVYLLVAEVWLAIESRFGLGKVSVRPPIASKKRT